MKVKARVAIALVAFAAFSTHAMTFTVTTTADSGAGSLRDAIAQANALPGADIVNFAVTGTILLTTGQIQISDALSIVGPGAGGLTIDANANSRIFSIFVTDPACPALDGTNYLVSISGLRLTNAHRTTGNTAGAIFTEHSLALDSVTLDNNVAGNGGAVGLSLQYPGQSLTINNSQFLNNKGQPLAGAANSFGGALSAFEKCSGVHTAPVSIAITGSLFNGNQGLPNSLSGFGGAIAMDTSADVTITDTRIVNNTIVVPNPPVADQLYHGGGIHAHAKSLTIVRSEIANNAVTDITGADVTRSGGLHLYNNAPDLQGPGDLFSAKLINSTVSGNSSSSTAGAMLVFGNVAFELDNSTVNGNLAAPTRTGGIVISTGPTSPPSASNATTPTMTVVSSILANDSGTGGDVATSISTIPTFTINANSSLIGVICPLPSCDISVSGSNNLPLGTNPMVGPLAFNGGATRTHALLAGSPAINAGSNPLALTTDQRGPTFARVVGANADMGAYEFVPGVAPILQSAVSRKVHGGAGTFDLPLSLVATNPTTEPRIGPSQTIVMIVRQAHQLGRPQPSPKARQPPRRPTFSGNDVIVVLTGVNNQQYVTITLTNVASVDGGTGGSGSVRVGFLVGDVNQNRVISAGRSRTGERATGAVRNRGEFLKDVNASGTLTVVRQGHRQRQPDQGVASALMAPRASDDMLRRRSAFTCRLWHSALRASPPSPGHRAPERQLEIEKGDFNARGVRYRA